MKELLSNDEIDVLLDLFRAEGPPLDDAHGAARGCKRRAADGELEVSTVDLLQPNRLSREQIRGLERRFESCAKTLAATMSDRLRLDMVCDCVAAEQLRFRSWLRMLKAPVVTYVLQLTPLETPALLSVSTGVLYGAVDRILGGAGRVQEMRSELTVAELTVADAFVGPCLDRLCASLADLGKLSWSIESRCCSPSMVQILEAQDVLLSVYFQVSGELLPGDLRLAIPLAPLEPLLGRIGPGRGAGQAVEPGALRETTTRTVQNVPLTLSVVLGETQVPLRQLLELQVGDVVTLPTQVGQQLVAPVQGRPKFRGQVGTRGSVLAFQVASVMES